MIAKYGVDDPDVKKWINDINNGISNTSIGIGTTIGTTIGGDKIEKGFEKAGAKYGDKLSNAIWSNRYSITLPDGRILGQTSGATSAVRKAAKNTATGFAKGIGRGFSEVGGTFIGVGIDMWQGDTAKEAWGKGITTGIASVGVTGAIELGSAALVSAGVLANPIGVGVVGGIAIAVGIGFANDWLRDNFKGVKNFEDNMGNAVVSGWNKVSNKVGDFFGGVFL